jgi:Mg-chelatase subunit ChlI
MHGNYYYSWSRITCKIVEERISFDQSPQTWFEKYESEQFSIQDRIITAQFIK